MDRASTPWRARARPALKLVLGALVVGFAGRHVLRSLRELETTGREPRVDGLWAAASMGLYLLGLFAFGAYFWRVLGSSATPVGPWAAIRAYVASHAAKYVPGKAMVVVMRVGMVAPHGARPATAAFATLYETLAMMAAGGFVAAIGFATGPPSWARLEVPFSGGSAVEVPFWLLGLALGLAFLVVVWPGVFPRLAGLVRVPLPNVGPDALPRFSTRLLAEGLAWSVLGWVLLGLSQVALIRGLSAEGLAPSSWPLAIASVALATVAGFAVPIAPGGLGVREWVLWTALGSALDRDLAVLAAVGLRLAWATAEVVAYAAVSAIRPSSGDGGRGPA